MGTAHPHHDPRTRERFSYEIELVPPSGLRIVSERNGRRRELAWIPDDRPGYLHSFGLTDRFVVVFVQPWEFDLATFLSPDGGPIVTVVPVGRLAARADPRSSIASSGGRRRDVRARPRLRLPPHQLRSTNGDDVVIDVCAHRDASIVDALYLRSLRQPGPSVPQAVPRRLTVRPGRSKVHSRELADGNIELPRTDYATVNGRPYRYAYGVGVRHPRTVGLRRPSREARHQAGRAERLAGARFLSPASRSSPAARARRARTTASCSRSSSTPAASTSFLLVLDARDMSELARASVPHHIPFGFHGVHAPAA